MPIESGQMLLHYRLIEKIGEGGMGVVWKALDTTLDREVAIKVLLDAAADDPDRLARFEREAKLLAALNHPGVASIFGVHRSEDVRFLAMELVAGEDLGRLLSRARLPLGRTVAIGRQIARALEAAHAQGIVHRDLKPSNIVVADGDVVKVLDFGLAKALTLATAGSDPSQWPTIEGDRTGSGVILGTVAYMSPEQARGKPVDGRSDIWSFGCILWECLAGEVLFGAETASDSIGAILGAEPDWDRLPEGTPPALRHLLLRCLAKEPSERLHHIADARIELEDRRNLLQTDTVSVEAQSGRFRRAARDVGIALVTAAAVTIAGFSGLFDRNTPEGAFRNPLEGAAFTKLTDFEGSEIDAAISPNGDFVAFVADRDGPFEVFVGQIGAGEFRNLTRDNEQSAVEDVQAPVRSVGFTGDGSEVWLGGGIGRRMRSVPLLGGPMRNLFGEEVVNADWEPNGDRIVYHTRAPGDPLYLEDRNRAQRRLVLGSEPGHHQHYPIWSRDRRWIYLVRGRPATGDMDLWRVQPDGAGLERLTNDKKHVAYPAPIDDETVLFTAREEDGAGPWLWALDVPSRTSRRVSFGTEQFSSVAASADGRRLVATVASPRAGLWRVPILDRVATDADARQVTDLPTLRALAPRFGSRSLFYLSSRGAGDGLWRYRDGRAVEIWKGTKAALLEPVAVSSTEHAVALVIRREGRLLLHRLSADGAELRLLTDELDAQGAASWSPDGRWLVTGGSDADGPGLFKIAEDGGSPERMAGGEAVNPVWSPRGDLIVFAGAQINAQQSILAIRPDGTRVELPDIKVLRFGERVRFLPDGSGLVYMQGLRPSQDFWLLDLETMSRRQLTRLDTTATMRTFDVSPDGTELVFDRLKENSDIVLIDLAADRRSR